MSKARNSLGGNLDIAPISREPVPLCTRGVSSLSELPLLPSSPTDGLIFLRSGVTIAGRFNVKLGKHQVRKVLPGLESGQIVSLNRSFEIPH